MLSPKLVKVAVCGDGPLTLRRLGWLRDCGADPFVYAPAPSDDLALLAGPRIINRFPAKADFDGLGAIWIADLAPEVATSLADSARAAGTLTNVEDVIEQCDFHTPSVVHRGRLTLAIGTGGASPAIASIVRQRLEAAFPSDWSQLIEDVATDRLERKALGATFSELVEAAKTKIAEAGL